MDWKTKSKINKKASQKASALPTVPATWALALILLFFFLAYQFLYAPGANAGEPMLGDVHEHADFKVYLNGEAYNFSQQKYMSDLNGKKLSPFMHLHDGDGEVMHQHMSKTTLWLFFRSLGMELNSSCIVLDNKTSYCTGGNNRLRMLVNGRESTAFDSYDFNDLDRILVTYGSESEEIIKKEMDSVSDKACIQSNKCPERGTAPEEGGCAVGQDSACGS